MIFLTEAIIGCLLFTAGVAAAMKNPLGGTTIMIDAGCNYDRLGEKMKEHNYAEEQTDG